MKTEMIKECLHSFKTPMYVFDIDTIIKRLAYLKTYLGEHKICYAIKANTFIVKEMVDYVDFFEVCSIGEMEICKSLDIPPEKIVVSGVHKSAIHIDTLIRKCNTIAKFTVESLKHYAMLKESAIQHKTKINILIRLTSGNQFGVCELDLRAILHDAINCEYINVLGVQYFSGTQKHSKKKLQKEIEKLDELLLSLMNKYQFDFFEFEFGTGSPVCYFEGEEFDEEEYVQDLSQMLSCMKSNVHITLELGRSIAASCGIYLTSVVDTKSNQNGNYAIVDGGMHQMVYYGQVMAMKKPFFNVYPQKEGETRDWTICGSLCTVNDILLKQVAIQGLEEGSVIAFENVGAYSVTEGISLFLTRDLPRVLLHKNGELLQVRDKIYTDKINLPHY